MKAAEKSQNLSFKRIETLFLKNFADAKKYFAMAAGMGHTDSTFGGYLAKEGDPVKATEYYEKAAKLG